jgi:hypothetical protein
MKITAVFLTILGLTASVSASDHSPEYIHILAEVILDGESELFFGSSSGGTAIEPGDYANFVVWGGRATSGIRVGGMVNWENNLRVEIPVSLTVLKQAKEMFLYGRVWLMHISDTTVIDGGRRISIKQPIRFNDPLLVRLGRLPDGVSISLNITVSREPISADSYIRTQPIQIVTVQYQDGERISHHAAGRPASAHPSPVKTSFSLPIDIAVSGAEAHAFRILEYEADVRLSISPDSLIQSRLVDFELIRTYRIDTLHYSLEDIKADLTFTSTYKRRLAMEPGVELRIIVPPDTPSVHGFDIEDTLIVVPPK